MGDTDSGGGHGPLKPLAVDTLTEAMAEARAIAREDAEFAASAYAETAVREWYVFVDDGSGELVGEAFDVERADPEEPACAAGQGGRHDWHNPDPAIASYPDPHGGGATAVRICRECGTVRKVRSSLTDQQGNRYDSVSYTGRDWQ